MSNKVNPNIIFICLASILIFIIVIATSSSKEGNENEESNTPETSTVETTSPVAVTPQTSTNNPKTPTPTTVPKASSGYKLADVSTHKAVSDCWLVISSKVYNVTSFIGEHPGGKSQITTRCGTDVTTAFNGGVYKHSSYAKGLLPTYFVGNLSL